LFIVPALNAGFLRLFRGNWIAASLFPVLWRIRRFTLLIVPALNAGCCVHCSGYYPLSFRSRSAV